MFIENIIIGAGPSSLQLGYYFMKNEIPYIILERDSSCASFFNKYPHSKKLISINKKYTGKTDKEFNLRHDWNSLLNDENFLFSDFTDELYPSSLFLYNYLNEFSKKFNLSIQFNTNVTKIDKDKDNNRYILTLNNNDNEIVTCNKLIIATGISKPVYPNLVNNVNRKEKNVKHYADYENNYFNDKDNLEKYKNKKVLIIGGGNSSYELANILQNFCSNIVILGSNKPLSIVTHYVGDIRSVYLPFLDTFYLKSLNGVDTSKKELLNMFNIIKDENNEHIKKYNDNLILLEKIKNENEELLNKYNNNIKLITIIQQENNININKLLNKKNE
jgi:cation diffusion facilitator CzcD-associated flavoprotein CzcO